MKLERSQLRSMVLDYLRHHTTGDQVSLYNEAGAFFQWWNRKQKPIAYRDNHVALHEIFHEMYIEGIVASGSPGATGYDSMGWPFFYVTEYGLRALSDAEYQPHDPEGFIEHFSRAVPQAHSDVTRYLSESLNCFRQRLLLASAVMLGCASEKAILELIETFASAIQDQKNRDKFKSEVNGKMISRKYDALWKRLEPIASRLPGDLGDDLKSMLDGSFHLIRTTRNDAGHPAGKLIDRDTMRGNLLLFPAYCRRVYSLIDHFQATPV